MKITDVKCFIPWVGFRNQLFEAFLKGIDSGLRATAFEGGLMACPRARGFWKGVERTGDMSGQCAAFGVLV